MKKTTKRRLQLLAIILLIGGAVVISNPKATNINWLDSWLQKMTIKQGLDLRGGVHLVYEADMKDVENGKEMESLKGVQDVIERRVNAFGVAEPVIRPSKIGGSYRLIVELAGIDNVEDAKKMLKETPFLEFKEEGETLTELSPEMKGFVKKTALNSFQSTQENEELKEEDKPTLEEVEERLTQQILQPQWQATGLSGKQLEKAQVNFGQQTGQPTVSLQFNGEGKDLFKEITERSKGKRVAIFLDGMIISAPTVQSVIRDGRAEISGGFTLTEAKDLAQRLNAGALPVPIKLVQEQSIEASLGAESLQKSLRAAFWGLVAVAVFMVLYYRLAGVVAVIALASYAVLMVAVIKLSSLSPFGITLTLPGIAGFILSVGMAVDANILIFERIREELKRGRELSAAIKEGFKRAWTSIRDGNYSTLITSFILVIFGSGFIQGFALILIMGVLLSMFTAIVITRIVIRLLETKWLGKRKRWIV
jgi:protein-export membrane protein SecD